MNIEQKRNIFQYIFICILFFQYVNAQETISLESVIEEIRTINEKFIIIEKKDFDANVTTANESFDNIDSKKEQLIIQVPPLITQGKYTPIIQKDFDQKISDIIKKIQTYKSKSDFINSIKYSIKLSTLQADNIFYKTIDKIRNLSLKSINKRLLKEPIEESLLSLKALALPKLSTEKNTLQEDQLHIDELKNEKNKAKSIIQTYTQVLNYLYDNSYLFSDIGIGYAIEYINGILPFKNRFFNTGKLLFGLLIIGIFTGIFFLLKRRNFFIFIYTSSRKEYSKEIKRAIIRATNRPLYALVTLYCVDLCLTVYYNPYALPENIKTIINGSYIVIIAWIFIGIAGGYGIAIINSVVQKKNNTFRKEVANILLKVIYFFIGSIAFLLTLSNFGVNVSAIVASLGIGGLAVALAAKDILANFFASIMLLFDNAFSQGDWIQTGSIEGTVVEIGLRRTTIRTFENALLFVPNSSLSDSPITNWSRRKVGRRIKMSIGS